ncbi:MAG: hypothetical protein U5R49_04645 [Deltaproteobacteria bacterium]|nr:hypothetical protein [Deltaproteobacteria bacterium]
MRNKTQSIFPEGDAPEADSFEDRLLAHGVTLTRGNPTTVQLNLGRLCRLSCIHCHVDAGPHRKEIISRGTLERILHWLRKSPIRTVDLTGGAPELIPDFYWLRLQPEVHGLPCDRSL